LNQIEEETGKVWYVDDSWMVNLKSGETTRESYVQDKEEYMTQKAQLANYKSPTADSILMLEVRGNTYSLWVND